MASKNGLPPGPKGLPLLGNVIPFRQNQLSYLLHLQKTYDRMATISIGTTPIIMFFRPEHVRYVLVENPGNFTNKEVAGGLVFGNLLVLSLLAPNATTKVAEGFREFVGDSLLSTDGVFHDKQRRLIQPAFSKKRVDSYAEMIVSYTRDTMARWQPHTEINIADDMEALILRIIAKILADIDITNQASKEVEMVEGLMGQPVSFLEGLLNLKIDLPFTLYGKRMAAKHKADAYIYQLIDSRRAENRDVGDMLSTMLEARDEDGNPMSTREIHDALVTLIAAGNETTTNSLNWTLHLLTEHPTVCEKVVSELQTVLGGRDPKVSDLPNLTYLDWVVQESMRIYPSAWTQGRRAVKAFDLDGYHFPEGTLLMFSQWVLHRLPDIWGDPDVFRPERWDPARGEKVPQWAYFPFGGGTRICVGKSLAQLELRLMLATLLQHYIPRRVPNHPIEPLPLITLRLKHGVRVKMEPVPAKPSTAEVSKIQGCPYHVASTQQAGDADVEPDPSLRSG
jgi:cytochrome P450